LNKWSSPVLRTERNLSSEVRRREREVWARRSSEERKKVEGRRSLFRESERRREVYEAAVSRLLR
jgi:hypothetical protein